MTPWRIRARKGGEPLVCLTAYDHPTAQRLDPLVDLLLVGDSLGMVVYGEDSTLGVTLDMMVAHGRAVARAAGHACVVVDLPFGSYQESREQAFRSAARLLAETGCAAVKLEGGREMAETIAFLVERGIPVMGHVGLKPQMVRLLGGFRTQGRTPSEAEGVIEDTRAVDAAGAFSIVVEGTVEEVAAQATAVAAAPTIGIGASASCDGQILVTPDLAGLTVGHVPRFAKQYGQLGEALEQAVATYAEEVRARRFPGEDHVVHAGSAPAPDRTPKP
ncbi:MAG: 3-methyl-2-oxobutanoate hydroxymethyltransferase [Tistlia sp.]|uniref:3-methyl-2-oxobutanoate hydroxymethyltransferase n=1 Tax=Tistlia sp. TaxID=3057121 RepID=UPI0034A17CDD